MSTSWVGGAPRAAGRPGTCAVFALALWLALANAGPAQAKTSPALRAGVTSILFAPEILADLGIELVDVVATEAPLRDGAAGFALDVPASKVALDAVGSDFEGFAASELRHAGGFALRAKGERIDLSGFQLRETAPPYALELRDARGRRWFLVDKPHALLTPDLLSISVADLVIAPELASWLGRADLAHTYVAVLDMRLSFAAPRAASTEGAAAALGLECVGNFSLPVDLRMLTLANMTQAAREAGVRVAMAPNATVRNLGPGDVMWYRAIDPDGPVGPHPYLALHFYRLADGVLEQIGRADVKHTFFATNTACDCDGGQVLYTGCEDLYGISTNLDRMHLAPRSEIDALTLAWSSLGSHFDGVPADDFRSHGGNGAHDSFQHRLVVKEPDLQTVGARYFYDGWYMAPNDSDLLNSMAFREVDPTFGGSTWTFPAIDAGTRNGSILDVFVDPLAVLPGEATELVDTGVGRVQLAVRTSALGGGQHHYEYALMNFDVERQIRSFSVPVGPGGTVTGIGFGDANGNALDDWTGVHDGTSVTWTAPPGNALDWGTLYNFRMNVDAAPLALTATLEPLAPGAPAEFAVETLPEPGAGVSSTCSLALLALLARRRSRRARRGC
jgi:hypothetical protein